MEKWEAGTRNRSGARVRTFTGSDRLGCRLSCQKNVTFYSHMPVSSCLIPMSVDEDDGYEVHDRSGKRKDGYVINGGHKRREEVSLCNHSSVMPRAKEDDASMRPVRARNFKAEERRHRKAEDRRRKECNDFLAKKAAKLRSMNSAKLGVTTLVMSGGW